MIAPSTDEKRHSFLLFDIGSEMFAVSTNKVNEIIDLPELARVPALPPCVRGLMNLRGTVLPVVDLAVKFGFPEAVKSRYACVVVVEVDHEGATTPIGLITPFVHDVVAVSQQEIEESPMFGGKIGAAYLKGIIRRDDRFALVMDTDVVLSIDELLGARAEVARATAA